MKLKKEKSNKMSSFSEKIVLVRNHTPHNFYVAHRKIRDLPEEMRSKSEWSNLLIFEKKTHPEQTIPFNDEDEYCFIVSSKDIFVNSWSRQIPLETHTTSGIFRKMIPNFSDFGYHEDCNTILTLEQDGADSFVVKQKIERICHISVCNLSSTKEVEVETYDPYRYMYEYCFDCTNPKIRRATVTNGKRNPYEYKTNLPDNGSGLRFFTVGDDRIKSRIVLLKKGKEIFNVDSVKFDDIVDSITKSNLERQIEVNLLVNKGIKIDGTEYYFLQL